MTDTRERIADALRRRLYPNSGVHLKQLAHAVGRSGEAVRQWAAGEASIKAEDLYEVARFLHDPAPIAEIFGEMARDKTTLRRGQSLWFTDLGDEHEAPSGHAEFVRRHLNMPLHAPGDMSAYAQRNLGWVSGELRDGLAALRYHDTTVAVMAARKAATWLLKNGAMIDSVKRSVFVGERWIDVAERDADAAAAAICRAAEIARLPLRLPWRVERLRLEDAPSLAPLVKAYREAPSRIVETAARMGKLSECSILRVSGTNVETVSVGSDVPCPHKSEFVGQNVFARADTAYAAVLHSHMIEATEGETLRWLRGSIFARPVSYLRAALYAGPETGLVLSVPILRASEEALSDARLCG